MLKRIENIKFTGKEQNIKINLSSNEDFLGYQQEIDNLVNVTGNELINGVNDTEVRRFKNYSSTPINFYFYDVAKSIYDTTFTAAGFGGGVNKYSLDILNSFFIFDFYDTYDPYTQTKIFRVYFTNLITTNTGTTYSIINNNQLSKWDIPISYLNKYPNQTITGYIKILFYNASNGKVVSFFNKDKEMLTTPEKMCFLTELDTINKTWRFTANQATAYELTNLIYANRLDNTVQNAEDKKQDFAMAIGTFNPITRTYINDLNITTTTTTTQKGTTTTTTTTINPTTTTTTTTTPVTTTTTTIIPTTTTTTTTVPTTTTTTTTISPHVVGEAFGGGTIYHIVDNILFIAANDDLAFSGWDAAMYNCNNLTLSGYTDWYLPTREEVGWLWVNKLIIPNIVWNGFYWTSEEYYPFLMYAWCRDFDTGYEYGNYLKTWIHRVRPVRTMLT